MKQIIHKKTGYVFGVIDVSKVGVEQLIAKAPEGAYVKVGVTTTAAFDSVGATISVGHTGNKTLLMNAVDVKPVGGKSSEYVHEVVENERGIYATVTAASATTGRVLVAVEFIFPSSQETEH